MNDPVWRIDNVLNPFNDSVQILAEPEEKGYPVSHPFVLPEDITLEERKDYSTKILCDTLKYFFFSLKIFLFSFFLSNDRNIILMHLLCSSTCNECLSSSVIVRIYFIRTSKCTIYTMY